MRKYFLLSAVALLATSTANATTDYAEVTAKATIEVAGTFTCDDIDFGTIVVKQGNEAIILDTSGPQFEPYGDLLSINSFSSPSCYKANGEPVTEDPLFFDMDTIYLKNINGDGMALQPTYSDGILNAILTIPANVKPGEYTGSFTLTITQE